VVAEAEEFGTLELLRGRDVSFLLEVTNPFTNRTLDNVTVEIEGYISQYIDLTIHQGDKETSGLVSFASTPVLNDIEYNETKYFLVKVSAPTYLEKGNYSVIFTITGDVNYEDEKMRDYVEKKSIYLIVREISGGQANITIIDAINAYQAMVDAGFPASKAYKLLQQAELAFNSLDYETAQELGQQIIVIKELAFEAHALIEEAKSKVETVSLSGVDAPRTSDLIDLAQTAFNREDFALAKQRAQEALSVYDIETQGEINIAFLFGQYWWAVLIAIFGTIVLGFTVHRRTVLERIDRQLEDSGNKELNINTLIRDAQDQCFNLKTMSELDYHKAMFDYQTEIAKIRADRVKLRSKREKIMKYTRALESLKKEDKAILKLIEHLQVERYEKRILSKDEYEKRKQEYESRRSEIEREIALLEAKIAKQKAQSGIKQRVKRKVKKLRKEKYPIQNVKGKKRFFR
jgi:hypothetical protein